MRGEGEERGVLILVNSVPLGVFDIIPQAAYRQKVVFLYGRQNLCYFSGMDEKHVYYDGPYTEVKPNLVKPNLVKPNTVELGENQGPIDRVITPEYIRKVRDRFKRRDESIEAYKKRVSAEEEAWYATLDTPRKNFIDGYLAHYDAGRAFLEAGFSANQTVSTQTASMTRQQAIERGKALLKHPRIAACIALRSAMRGVQNQIRGEEIIHELATVAFANIGDYLAWEDGEVTIRPSQELSREQLAAVESIEQKIEKDGTKTIKIKLYDKPAALRDLAKMVGVIVNRVEVGAPGQFAEIDRMNADELRQWIARESAKAGVRDGQAEARGNPPSSEQPPGLPAPGVGDNRTGD